MKKIVLLVLLLFGTINASKMSLEQEGYENWLKNIDTPVLQAAYKGDLSACERLNYNNGYYAFNVNDRIAIESLKAVSLGIRFQKSKKIKEYATVLEYLLSLYSGYDIKSLEYVRGCFLGTKKYVEDNETQGSATKREVFAVIEQCMRIIEKQIAEEKEGNFVPLEYPLLELNESIW